MQRLRGLQKLFFPALSLKNHYKQAPAAQAVPGGLRYQHTLYACFIGLVYHGRATEVALSLGRTVAHPVRSIRMEALYFPGASELEALFGTGVRLHLGHNTIVFIVEY